MYRFYLKIISPSILSIALFVLTIFLVIIPHFKENIINGKREMIKELTNSALSILSKYEQDERNGLLSREEAQKTAVSRILYLRYGEENKDYFWITDLHPIMIMHPYRPDLNGTDLTNFNDPNGKKLFVEMVNTVKLSENGYVDYMWQWKDNPQQIVEKLSYVKLFKPWGWIIGTGVYVEDVKKEIKTLTKRLLWISTAISVLIAFLLFFISSQSIKIEYKRIQAEKELHESKEKYRTLVEAATEGLIMILSGKISFANSVFANMTGYELEELNNLFLIEIIDENNNGDILYIFSRDIIKDGQYELNLKKKNGVFFEALVTSSNAMFYGNPVNILIIKDITVDTNLTLSSLDYQKLIRVMNVGFFRILFKHKGQLIFANETTIRMLGYDTFNELSDTGILDLLYIPEEIKKLRKDLLETGFVKNKILKVLKKNKEILIVTLTLVVFNDQKQDELICDGIIEDITSQEIEKEDIKHLITELKSGNFLIEQSIKEFIRPIYSLNNDSIIKDVIKVFSKRSIDYVLISKKEKEYIGIITSTDIQKRVVALNLHPDNPAYLIMSSPVHVVYDHSTVFEAVSLCEEMKINHLAVKNDANEIIGVFMPDEIFTRIKDSLFFLVTDVYKAETEYELKHCYDKLQFLLNPLIKSGISCRYITRITSTFADAVTRRIIELCIKESGNPPVPFAFICMGSEGRMEETLLTDQDNAIIFEDVPAEKEAEVEVYFFKLGEAICRFLNDTGYIYCKGNVMAMNTQWCKPIATWERYFSEWISAPEPQHLLDASIFFDFRNVYGDVSLTDRLRNRLNQLINDYPICLYHIAHQPVHTKAPQISTGTIITEKNVDFLDLKQAGNLIIMIARAYALKHNIPFTNTTERLNALKTKKIIHERTIDEILYIYEFLMKLRFRNQIELKENNLPMSNVLNTKKLIDIEIVFLRKILSILPIYQNKIAVDFRVSY
jgi:PAS domain S-box-containing protein